MWDAAPDEGLESTRASPMSLRAATVRWRYPQCLAYVSEVLLGGNIKEWLKARTVMLRSSPDVASMGEHGNAASSL